ncbi:hypothetical protein MYX07_04320 [Patescibacteria group bacterium AH-259-L07]|nr:hypothetical protein [Patescibacteria group bacterium AH-259-L07]
MERKDLKHITDEQISIELEEKEREFIASMGGWSESKQLPILTEKILLLRQTIEKFNQQSSRYSKVLIWLTVVMTIAVIIQIYLLIR